MSGSPRVNALPNLPWTRILVTAMVTAALLMSFAVRGAQAAPGSATQMYHDPIYGFSFAYPSSWTSITEHSGSHVTLVNVSTNSLISPSVQESGATPTAAVQAAIPSSAIDIHTRTVSGRPGIEYTLPFLPETTPAAPGVLRPRVQSQGILFAAANTSGSTNLYLITLTQQVTAQGEVTSVVAADISALELVANTFTLPTTIAPADKSSGSTPYAIIGGGSCDRICWADNNWTYDYYNDTGGRYCTGYSNGYTGCTYAAQAPSPNLYQPDFECAEFVSRALSEDVLIPGLLPGGYSGTSGVTSNSGSDTFGTYFMTYTPYSSDKKYTLINVGSYVGSTDYIGLYQYLIDTGIGVSLGHNTVSGLTPGDVVFFYNSSTTFNDSTREHVMIVTSASSSPSPSTTLLDGHNWDQYHLSLSNAMTGFPNGGYEVVHIRAAGATSYAGPSSLSGSGWNNFTDSYGQAAHWVYTTSQSSATASAQYGYPSYTTAHCAVAVYVPAGNATATVNFTVTLASGSKVSRTVYENNIDGWALLYKWGELSSTPSNIYVGNNNGTSGAKLGVGQMAYIC